MARKKAATTAPVTRPTTDISSIIASLDAFEVVEVRSLVTNRLVKEFAAQLEGKTAEELIALLGELDAKRKL